MKDKEDNNKKGAEVKFDGVPEKSKLWVPDKFARSNDAVGQADSPGDSQGLPLRGANRETAKADTKACSAPAKDDSNAELKNLQEEIESLRKAASERNEFLNLLQRVQADFDNYQKRIKKEKECWDKYQDEDLLRELLPALDNFDRTLKLKCQSEDAKCIINGVDLIKREIFRILEKRGIKQVKTVGEMLDPNYHEAMAVCESGTCKENEIVEELAPGYMLHDRLIRAAKVKIAKPKQEEKK